MKKCSMICNEINAGRFDNVFGRLYPASRAEDCRKRYLDLLDRFITDFGDQAAVIVSAPGRTEIGGNHTDHQHGNVLAAAVNLDIICVAAPCEEPIIRVQSIGYPLDEINLNDLSPQESEKGKSAALIRGIAKWFSKHDVKIGGFTACTTSDVLSGSGLSSSAAFEVAIGNAIARLFDESKTADNIAIAGQYAENHYFGKPSGLMDQMASSVGGFVQIDFQNPEEPLIRPVACDLSAYGYHLCIVDTKGSHADLTDEYASIASEMCAVARCFGKEYLRDVSEEAFYREMLRVRSLQGDRAVLRAIHFYRDNKLAVDSANALERGDITGFLQNTKRSGRSSLACLQNVFSTKQPHNQGLTLALDLSETLLEGKGAWRVHGGGFAGTIQAFVPDAMLQEFCDKQNALFGPYSCHVLTIRPMGGCEIISE